jgi:hypothetical protein
MRFVPNKLTRTIVRSALKSKKNSPQTFFGFGIVGVLGGTVLACRATLSLPDAVDDFQEEIEDVKAMGERRLSSNDDSYNEREYYKDLGYVYGKNTVKIAKLYGPSIIVGALSIGALTGSHVTLKRRNASLTAAVAAVSTAYEEYRIRVKSEIGADRELDIYHAIENRIITREDGSKEVIKIADPNRWSPYARWFDEASPYWEKNSEINRLYVQAAQNLFNNKLQIRGHVFLNEIYDHFGIEHSSAGAVVGWILGPEGDNYIDFGIFDAYQRDFVNGWERSILLDFNVDGVIYDKIGVRGDR